MRFRATGDETISHLEKMDKLRRHSINSSENDPATVKEYRHQTFRLASNLEKLVLNDLVFREDALDAAEALNTAYESVSFDPLQHISGLTYHRDLHNSLQRMSLALIGEDFRSMDTAHHIFQAMKYLELYGADEKKYTQLFDSILPCNGCGTGIIGLEPEVFGTRDKYKVQGVISMENIREYLRDPDRMAAPHIMTHNNLQANFHYAGKRPEKDYDFSDMIDFVTNLGFTSLRLIVPNDRIIPAFVDNDVWVEQRDREAFIYHVPLNRQVDEEPDSYKTMKRLLQEYDQDTVRAMLTEPIYKREIIEASLDKGGVWELRSRARDAYDANPALAMRMNRPGAGDTVSVSHSNGHYTIDTTVRFGDAAILQLKVIEGIPDSMPEPMQTDDVRSLVEKAMQYNWCVYTKALAFKDREIVDEAERIM